MEWNHAKCEKIYIYVQIMVSEGHNSDPISYYDIEMYVRKPYNIELIYKSFCNFI